MSKSLNQCNFIGNLGAEVKTVQSKSGKDMAILSLAVNSKKNNEPKTEWITVLAFDKTAEIAKNYASSGDLVYISGSLITSDEKTQSGDNYKKFAITANQILLLNKKQKDGVKSSKEDLHSPESFNTNEDEIPF